MSKMNTLLRIDLVTFGIGPAVRQRTGHPLQNFPASLITGSDKSRDATHYGFVKFLVSFTR